MSLFLITFFLLYGGMHAYAYFKVRSAYALSGMVSAFLVIFMVLMTLAPVLVRISERQGLDPFARLLSYVGYGWMGVLFLFFSFSILIDGYRLLGVVAGALPKVSAGLALLLPLTLSAGVATYGYFDALDIRVERITITSDKLPAGHGGVRIAQISDVHVGLIVREERLKRIVEAVKAAEPHVLVSTGDLVDGQIDGLDGLSGMLRDLSPPFGKFAVTGNHEFYAGLDQALDFTRKSGFTILRGERVILGGVVALAGVDDATGRTMGAAVGPEEGALLPALPVDVVTVLLKHRPIVNGDALGRFDLQLSGHTHKGQIFPFSLVTRFYYDVDSGYRSIAKGSSLYVSRGSGTWGPPIRFLSPPEVTIIDIVRP